MNRKLWGLIFLILAANFVLCTKSKDQNIKEKQTRIDTTTINKKKEKNNQSLNINKRKRLTTQYTCAANSTADINLTLYDDNSLKLYFRSLLDEEFEVYKINGKWEKYGDDIQLTFYKKTLARISWLFDNNYVNDNHKYKFTNDSTVILDSRQDTLWLWGVACLRE